MKNLSVLVVVLLVMSCGAKMPPNAPLAAGTVRDVAVSKHDPASGKPDTSAVQLEPGVVLHLYEVVNTTQGRFHVAVGGDVKDVTLSTGTTTPLTFGTRILNVTLKSINARGANVRLEAKGDWQPKPSAHRRLPPA